MESQKSLFFALFILIVAINSKNVASSTPDVSLPSGEMENNTVCMDLLTDNMATCITYLSKGSTDLRPDPDCCTGLKTVLNVNPLCLCDAMKNAINFGVEIDMGRATSFAADCNVDDAPSIDTCNGPNPSLPPPSKHDKPNKKKPSASFPTTSPPAQPSSSPSVQTPPMTPSLSSSPSPQPSSAKGTTPSTPPPPITPTMGPVLPSPSDDDNMITVGNPPPKSSSSSSSVAIIVPYAMLASCNIFLHLFS